MRIGTRDAEVIKSFIAHKPADGHKLSTDGVTLDGHWVGGTHIAEYVNDGLKFNDLGSRAAQTVQRAVAKSIAGRRVGRRSRKR